MRAKRTMASTILQGKVDWEMSQGKPGRQWMNSAKIDGLSINAMWRELEGLVARRKLVSRVVTAHE